MNEVLFNVILGLIPVIATVITGLLVPILLSKLGAEKLATIVKWVGYAVSAAEMLFPEAKSGEAKKAYVIEFIDNLFNKKKVVITKEQISVLIESIVAEINGVK